MQPENVLPQDALPPEVEEELRRRASVAPDPSSVQSATPLPPAVPPPPVAPPPLGDFAFGTAPAGQPASKPSAVQAWLKKLGPFGAFLALLLGKLKFLLVAGKFILPVLKTGGSMLLSIWVYSMLFGWKFAVGFVLCILVHEMGHVYMAWRTGVPVSAPLFIPMFGALITQKRWAKSTWDEALIGIGGPIGGAISGVVCLAVFWVTGYKLFLALAATAFWMNLFNMLPLFPLDGGWITGAISPRLWILGLVAIVVGYGTGYIRNYLLLFLLLMSLPRLWAGIRTGNATPPGQVPVTGRQRILMSVAYFGLAGVLVFLMVSSEMALA